MQHDIGRGRTAEDAVAQRFNDFATRHDGLHHQAFQRAAIVFGHHQILGHVDQATRQVTRVRGLQRRVGQPLTGAVRRDEVLQNVETFAEVRGNRRLDDRAVRFRHQAACPPAGESALQNRGRPSRPS